MDATEEQSEDDLFSSLVDSAFEFLNKAIDEFDGSPKFSIVHFAISIELFLKARLMREHWSLLVDKIDQADRKAFFRGEMRTVGPESAMQRLKKIAEAPVPENSKDIFLKIAQHRNKMVHFVHDDELGTEQSQAAKIQIVAEQCEGWLALRLLLDRWRDFFNEYDKKIQIISSKMERHRAYLEEKFKSKADEIKAHIDDRRQVSTCPSCHFEAVLVSDSKGQISPASCLVCWYSGSEVQINCPEDKCRQKIVFSSYEGPPDQCSKCEAEISVEVIVEALDTGEPITPDNYFDHVAKNCPYCHDYHTVVEHHDWFVCTNCFEIDDNFGVCGHCSEGQLGGVSELSSLTGCEFCDGNASRYADD